MSEIPSTVPSAVTCSAWASFLSVGKLSPQIDRLPLGGLQLVLRLGELRLQLVGRVFLPPQAALEDVELARAGTASGQDERPEERRARGFVAALTSSVRFPVCYPWSLV